MPPPTEFQGKLLRGGILLVLLLLVCSGLATANQGGTTATSSLSPPTVPVAAPTASTAPASPAAAVLTAQARPEAQVGAALAVLGDLVAVRSINYQGRDVVIEFQIQDNLTADLVRFSVPLHIKQMLDALSAQPSLRFDNVTFTGYYPLTDTAGQRLNTQVVKATYSRSTVYGTAWRQVLTENTYAHADALGFHPAFQPAP